MQKVVIKLKKEEEVLLTDNIEKDYEHQIRKIPLLGEEEQLRLLNDCYRGDSYAKRKILEHNLRLPWDRAKIFANKNRHMKLMDIAQEGNIGLAKTIENYNPNKGNFSTFAVEYIDGSIKRALTNYEDEINKPASFIIKYNEYKKLAEYHQKAEIPLPEDAEICRMLNITQECLDNIRTYLNTKVVSLNLKVDEKENTELGSLIEDDKFSQDEMESGLDSKDIFWICKTILTPLQYFIIYFRKLNGEKTSLEELAKVLGISRQRVREDEAKAMNNIKPYLMPNSPRYANLLKEIRAREGRMFYNLNVHPILPTSIAKYLYIREKLEEKEKELLKLKLFGNYEYSTNDYYRILNVSLKEYQIISESLEKKLQIIANDIPAFKRFESQLIKNYGTEIFGLDLDEKLDIIDYENLQDFYSQMTLEEIEEKFQNQMETLSQHERNLLNRFFEKSERKGLAKAYIEQVVNTVIYGYTRNDTSVPIRKLYKYYRLNKGKFTKEQRLYLESYVFQKKDKSEFLKKYPESTLMKQKYSLMERLEAGYYNIDHYFENMLTKEEYKEVRKQYKEKFTKDRLKMLDLFYGVGAPKCTLSEIAKIFKKDYDKMRDLLKTAREFATSLYTERNQVLNIDKSIYIPYILNPHYEFTEETRTSLNYFLIDNLSYEIIAEKTGLSKNRISHIITEGIRKIDFYRYEMIKPSIEIQKDLGSYQKSELLFIPRAELDILLDDVHLPISKKEREIICYLFELKGYPYKTIEELSWLMGNTKKSIRRRYLRAILNIKKYKNNEIKMAIDYETDIAPNLKYFGTRDKEYIVDYYKNGLSTDDIAKKYNLTKSEATGDIQNMKITLYRLMNDSNTKKFDFDYYNKMIDSNDLPFYGNRKLAKQIFDLRFGMNGERRKHSKEIIEILQLNVAESVVNRVINKLMISICKRKDGIKREKHVELDEIIHYYSKHKDELSNYRKLIYERCIKNRMENIRYDKNNAEISFDIIKENNPDYFCLETATHETVLKLIRKHGREIPRTVRCELIAIFGLSERDIMNGKEKNHVYRILNKLEKERKLSQEESYQRQLKKD